jgi:hypothetical protein
LECDGGGNFEPRPVAVLSTSFEDAGIETMKHMLDTYLKGNIHSIEAAMPSSGPAKLAHAWTLQSFLFKPVNYMHLYAPVCTMR